MLRQQPFLNPSPHTLNSCSDSPVKPDFTGLANEIQADSHWQLSGQILWPLPPGKGGMFQVLQVAEAANTIYKDSAAGEPACSPGDTNSLLPTSCS